MSEADETPSPSWTEIALWDAQRKEDRKLAEKEALQAMASFVDKGLCDKPEDSKRWAFTAWRIATQLAAVRPDAFRTRYWTKEQDQPCKDQG